MKQKVDSQSMISVAAHTAENASAAALSASEAAKTAADNAMIAAKAAADSATTIAVVATDTSWMKKSLEGIEMTLDQMQKAYVTASQHLELVKRLDEHEIRLNTLETSNTRLNVMLVIGSGILTFLVGLLIFHIFKSG